MDFKSKIDGGSILSMFDNVFISEKEKEFGLLFLIKSEINEINFFWRSKTTDKKEMFMMNELHSITIVNQKDDKHVIFSVKDSFRMGYFYFIDDGISLLCSIISSYVKDKTWLNVSDQIDFIYDILNSKDKHGIVNIELENHSTMINKTNLASYRSLSKLREDIEENDFDESVRADIWLIFLKVLPLDFNKQHEVLKIRLEEYLVYRNQLDSPLLLMDGIPCVLSSFLSIDEDLERTFSLSHNPKMLSHVKNVLYSFSLYFSSIGYTQGLNHLASDFFSVISSSENNYSDDEKETLCFWSLVHFLKLSDSPALYQDINQKLETCIEAVVSLLKTYEKELVRKEAVQSSFSQMYIAYFSQILCESDLFKLWDNIILSENMEQFIHSFMASLVVEGISFHDLITINNQYKTREFGINWNLAKALYKNRYQYLSNNVTGSGDEKETLKFFRPSTDFYAYFKNNDLFVV